MGNGELRENINREKRGHRINQATAGYALLEVGVPDTRHAVPDTRQTVCVPLTTGMSE